MFLCTYTNFHSPAYDYSSDGETSADSGDSDSDASIQEYEYDRDDDEIREVGI